MHCTAVAMHVMLPDFPCYVHRQLAVILLLVFVLFRAGNHGNAFRKYKAIQNR